MHLDQVREPSHGAGELVRPSERLAVERRQLVDVLRTALTEARDTSHLPDRPSAGAALHDLVVDTRLAT